MNNIFMWSCEFNGDYILLDFKENDMYCSLWNKLIRNNMR